MSDDVHTCPCSPSKVTKFQERLADLAGSDTIKSVHLAEALQYRQKLIP